MYVRSFRAWIGCTVIVSAEAFDVKGRLTDVRGDVLVLRDAVHLANTGEMPIDGTLLVPGAQVRYVQVP